MGTLKQGPRLRHPAIPVVVISGSDRASDVIRAIDTGAMGFVPKRASNQLLFEALRSWRKEQAQAQHVPPYVIFHDATLAEIAAARPATLAALGKAGGVGQGKLDRYGEAVLKVVREN